MHIFHITSKYNDYIMLHILIVFFYSSSIVNRDELILYISLQYHCVKLEIHGVMHLYFM